MIIDLIVILAIVEVVLPLFLFVFRHRMIFLPSSRPSPEEGLELVTGTAEIRLIRVPRSDGRLLATYDARPAMDGNTAAPVIIFFHGNAGNIAFRAPLLEEFVAGTGVRTLLFDYSGYGGNEGWPSEKEACLDGEAVYDYLVTEGVPPERIVFYGESLGAAVALEVATRRSCAGVVAQSTFSSASSFAMRVYPWIPLTALLVRGTFPSIDHVREIDAPLLVVHGTRDGIIPIAEGQKLHAGATDRAEFLAVDGAGHNDFFEVAGPEYLRLVGDRVRTWTSNATAHVAEQPPQQSDDR